MLDAIANHLPVMLAHLTSFQCANNLGNPPLRAPLTDTAMSAGSALPSNNTSNLHLTSQESHFARPQCKTKPNQFYRSADNNGSLSGKRTVLISPDERGS
jgi:hypothetical protein